METQGHLTTNPGLRAHSVDPDNNLMKRFVVAYHPKGGFGWVESISFDSYVEAMDYLCENIFDNQAQVFDNKTQKVLYQDSR